MLPRYRDSHGRQVTGSPDSLIAVLASLGAEVRRPEDAPAALRARHEAAWRETLSPVAVAWQGRPAAVDYRCPARLSRATLRATLVTEQGETRSIAWPLASLTPVESASLGTQRFLRYELPLPALPLGYHTLTLDGHTCRIIAAPPRAAPPPRPAWGLFLPLYALHTQPGGASGTLADLSHLLDWTVARGGSVAGVLPLLAAFLDEPCDPSPYTPASRIFWNEIYLDPTALPGLPPNATHPDPESFAADDLIDYPAAMRAKQPLFKEAAAAFFAAGADRQRPFRDFLARHPQADAYARFRAAGEQQRRHWQAWPAPMQRRLSTRDFDDAARRYHLYVQFAMHQQLTALSQRAHAKGAGLYLDMPLGVHASSFDTWRFPEIFLEQTSAGAPPDVFYPHGQTWGFPPLHPDRDRAQGYAYTIACLRHVLPVARVLRLDHVMGLHRIFCVPDGIPAQDGAYVQYRSQEQYAILSLESHRSGSWLVGENLGTVPGYVNKALRSHGIGAMYAVEYAEARPRQPALTPPPRNVLACVNTHDMVPFAAFWSGEDIPQRRRLGMLTTQQARQETTLRGKTVRALTGFLRTRRLLGPENDASSVYHALLAYLGGSNAPLVIASLEDLWGETEPQNVPGTGVEMPNWRRRARLSLEELDELPQARAVLDALARTRAAPNAPP